MSIVKYLKKTKFLSFILLVLMSNISYSDSWGYGAIGGDNFGGTWLFSCTGFTTAWQNSDYASILDEMNEFELKGYMPSAPLTATKLMEDRCIYGDRHIYTCKDSETGRNYLLKDKSVWYVLFNPDLTCNPS